MCFRMLVSFLMLFTIVSITTGAGYWGGSLKFDGVEEYSIIPSFDQAPVGNAAYTQELWFEIHDWGSYWNGFDLYSGFLLSRGGEYSLGGNHISLINHNIALTHWGRDSDTGFTVELNRWYHIASTWDGATETLYVNGQPVWSDGFEALVVDGGSMTFGKHDNVSGYYFNGQIDEVRVWDYARSEIEIAGSYLTQIDPNTPGLVGYWQFDETENEQVLDDSTLNTQDGYLGSDNQVEIVDPTRVCSLLPLDGDFDASLSVDANDLESFAYYWLASSCEYPDCCSLTDVNNDGNVDLLDFAVMASKWTESFID